MGRFGYACDCCCLNKQCTCGAAPALPSPTLCRLCLLLWASPWLPPVATCCAAAAADTRSPQGPSSPASSRPWCSAGPGLSCGAGASRVQGDGDTACALSSSTAERHACSSAHSRLLCLPRAVRLLASPAQRAGEVELTRCLPSPRRQQSLCPDCNQRLCNCTQPRSPAPMC
jgi:hypothetical protein